ncbi:uncharacterized protein BDR25DRAFT_63612 [Lindgomyces ingoldianus]|uniref:Uncharacterized protein n=1 Tax=Lindgomyces ingoldianus TaxID=673940 RepID=A0ACB6QKL0_9PLEO|nr:uncharacterized protein BDR25DRAFT_63612 [Lindgomyces ingoldianus]KAF2467554.1 hypothetical protein BDR25DRAFT_63612 [Lindgomyces ingoldianus]
MFQSLLSTSHSSTPVSLFLGNEEFWVWAFGYPWDFRFSWILYGNRFMRVLASLTSCFCFVLLLALQAFFYFFWWTVACGLFWFVCFEQGGGLVLYLVLKL